MSGSGKKFTRYKLRWLEQVFGRVTPKAFELAFLIASEFLNAKTLDAWPNQETLADRLRTHDRDVRRRIAELVAGGHLNVTRQGRDRPNRYRPVLHDRTPVSAQDGDDRTAVSAHQGAMTGQKRSHDRTKSNRKTGHQCPRNPFEEPFYEPSDSGAAASEYQAARAKRAADAAPAPAGRKRFDIDKALRPKPPPSPPQTKDELARELKRHYPEIGLDEGLDEVMERLDEGYDLEADIVTGIFVAAGEKGKLIDCLSEIDSARQLRLHKTAEPPVARPRART